MAANIAADCTKRFKGRARIEIHIFEYGAKEVTMHRKLFLLLILIFLPLMGLADTPNPIETIPWDSLPPVVDGQTHVLLLCVDVWNAKPDTLGNTDGIVLVTLDSRAHRVMLTSIIRDALVKRPDGKIGRINYIAKDSGPDALCRTISEHLGIRIESYLLFDFSQIQDIIDDLGGVDITITDEEASYLKRYAIPVDSTIPRIRSAGTYRFDGHSAVIYMRIRKAGGDFMRTQRVRTVLSTLADQCRSLSYDEARKLVDSVLSHTTLTNMNTDSMVRVMDVAYGLRECTVEELRIPIDGAVHAINYAGMAAQQVDWKACRLAMSDYLENSFLVLDDSINPTLSDFD